MAMASDSDDFESADEELVARDAPPRKQVTSGGGFGQWKNTNSAIDSESDDDNECIQPVAKSVVWGTGNSSVQTSGNKRRARNSGSRTGAASAESGENSATSDTAKAAVAMSEESKDKDSKKVDELAEKTKCLLVTAETAKSNAADAENVAAAEKSTEIKKDAGKDSSAEAGGNAAASENQSAKDKGQSEEKPNIDAPAGRKDRAQRQRKPKEAKSLGAKKLGAKVEAETKALHSDADTQGETRKKGPRPPPIDAKTPDEIRKKAIAEGKEPPLIEECWEFNEEETAKILQGMKDFGLGEGDKVKMPEELTSDKKFKEIFKPDGWEDLDDEEILAELDDKRVLPVLDKIAATSEQPSNSSWGSWGSWGVSSLISSATAGVTTLTSHVTHGLELLDQAVGAPHPEDLAKTDQPDDTDSIEEKSSSSQEVQPQLSFGFNDLISGVSSITKLVESTGTKVITGGLGTLETIGKKTMEVLQEGDPGLKKKRAFFLNEGDKPILSQMLREAKERADVEEKTLEEKQMTRKVHFESLFDDFQGLVHLEALEMLSKQCNIKIQQRLATLDTDEFSSIQETLEEVTELCDLGDEDEEDENDNNLQERLESACKDLGVAITYEKLHDIWKDTRSYLSEVSTPESTATEREVFQRAISTLARFTAFSVERFHKTAELLLIKERRSTVNEADALVQLTRILSGQIGIAANSFSNWLNERKKSAETPDSKVDITTIFLEAANASSYIQDAFRLLIPILQVGAI